MERNISTINRVEFVLALDSYDELRENDRLIKEMKTIIDILNKRDESIQLLMKIMGEKFEKVWGIPWELGQLIHGYVWNREDMSDISSTASFLSTRTLYTGIPKKLNVRADFEQN